LVWLEGMVGGGEIGLGICFEEIVRGNGWMEWLKKWLDDLAGGNSSGEMLERRVGGYVWRRLLEGMVGGDL